MSVYYKIKKKGRHNSWEDTVDVVSTRELHQKYPPEKLIRNNYKAIRYVGPKPKKIKKNKKPIMPLDYYKKLAKKTAEKQKKLFEKSGIAGKKRSYNEAIKKRKK